MSKIKKVLAVFLTLAMVLGMGMTTFAADAASTGKITVNGLTKGEETTVSLYKVVSWDEAQSEWKIEDWAKPYVTEDTANKEFKFDWDQLKANKPDISDRTDKSTTGTIEFNDLGIAAYLVIASGSTTDYNVMGAATYEYNTDNLMVPADKEINAKASNYTVVKHFANGDDSFVKRGDSIDYNIETTFPSYPSDETNRQFTITDIPEGLTIKNIKVQVGNDKLTAGAEYTLDKTLPAGEDESVTVAFTSDYIGMDNAHAGEAVVVTVTAEVTGVGEYSNTAETNKASEPADPVTGKTGSITINKVDKDKKVLKGAEFSFSLDGSKLQFVETEETGVYKVATPEEIADNNIKKFENVVAIDGVVTVKGLDEGTYDIVEEKAPDGYSIVEVESKTIEEGEDATVNITFDVVNTKLSSLPSTGGIGTTIFTIGGCLIMIIAAALFFASRRKENK